MFAVDQIDPKASYDLHETKGVFQAGTDPLLTTVSAVVLPFGLRRPVYRPAPCDQPGIILITWGHREERPKLTHGQTMAEKPWIEMLTSSLVATSTNALSILNLMNV